MVRMVLLRILSDGSAATPGVARAVTRPYLGRTASGCCRTSWRVKTA